VHRVSEASEKEKVHKMLEETDLKALLRKLAFTNCRREMCFLFFMKRIN